MQDIYEQNKVEYVGGTICLMYSAPSFSFLANEDESENRTFFKHVANSARQASSLDWLAFSALVIRCHLFQTTGAYDIYAFL